MKVIELTHGYVTVVDDEDFQYLAQYKWHYRDGYAVRMSKRSETEKQTSIRMHRVIMNPPIGMDIDHRNLDGLDNRRCNLRICTRSQNRMNCPVRKDNKSGKKGVSYSNRYKRWIAEITRNGKKEFLGAFHSVDDAAMAYNIAATRVHGEFARLNQ